MVNVSFLIFTAALTSQLVMNTEYDLYLMSLHQSLYDLHCNNIFYICNKTYHHCALNPIVLNSKKNTFAENSLWSSVQDMLLLTELVYKISLSKNKSGLHSSQEQNTGTTSHIYIYIYMCMYVCIYRLLPCRWLNLRLMIIL